MNELVRLRTVSGISQFTAARRSGVSRMRLNLAENNEIELTYREQAAVKRALVQAIQDKNQEIIEALAS